MRRTIKIFGVLMAFAGMVGLTSVANAQTASAACIDYNYGYSLTSKTCVKYIQVLTNQLYKDHAGFLGYRAPLVVDGKFGAKTQDAIRNIQAHTSVDLRNSDGSQGRTVYLAKDGIVGRQTWAVLCISPNIYASSWNRYAPVNAGCYKSNGMYRSFDYFYAVGWSYNAH